MTIKKGGSGRAVEEYNGKAADGLAGLLETKIDRIFIRKEKKYYAVHISYLDFVKELDNHVRSQTPSRTKPDGNRGQVLFGTLAKTVSNQT
uniref:Uncharacterized protein n=1 Tax=Oryza sativa subsp. japonica TaxID=39947 RepID=Q6ZDH9_ORYSJ|nr:hypothetical protein [Oryza sativa Japonica Group]